MNSLSARDLARHTPSTRDRYVDFLRIASISVVVLGHWLMAVVTTNDRGELHVENVLGMVPGLSYLTWLFQVMPLFFFVGGFSNLVTIDANRAKGRRTAEFIAGRVERLMRPVAVLLAVWIPAAIALRIGGVSAGTVAQVTRLVCQPLWFIGVYLLVTAAAPVMRNLHARSRVGVLVTLATLVAVVDGLRLGAGIAEVGYFNVVLVWLFAQQVGFFYTDGSLLRLTRRTLAAIATGAVAALALLTTFGPYSSSMVTIDDGRASNMMPPSICLVVLTVLQVALVMLTRTAVTRWLQQDKPWTAVIAGNGVIMTVFLWHLTAMFVAVATLNTLGFPEFAGGTSMWWLTKPLWFAAALIPLTGFVSTFGRWERPRAAKPVTTLGAYASGRAAIGVVLLAVGISGVAAGNLAALTESSRLLVIHVTLLHSMLAAICGWALVRIAVGAELPVARTKGRIA